MAVLRIARIALIVSIAAYLVLLGMGAFNLIDAWTALILGQFSVFAIAISAFVAVTAQVISWVRRRGH